MLEIKRAPARDVIRSFIPNRISTLLKDKIYFFVTFMIFIKSILFIGLLGTEKATWFNFDKAFMSVPAYLLMVAFAMIVLSFSFLFNGRKHLWALIIIDIIITIVIIGDTWYYRGFNEFLNYFLFTQTTNLDNLQSDVWSMARIVDIIFVMDIILLIIYAAFNKDLYRGVKRNIVLCILTFCIPLGYLWYASYKIDVEGRCFDGQHTFYRSWAATRTMSYLGPLGYHLFDGYNFYQVSKKYILTDLEKNQITAWYDKNKENLPDNEYAAKFKGKNLLVIQWESLENFVINQKIQGQEITPTLNKLLKNSLYFNNYHELVNSGTSSDADLMTNTGVYPVRDGSTFFRYPSNQYENSLPKVMQGMGYSTYAIHPDKALYWNWKPALTSIGFQNCYDSSMYDASEVIGLGISDKSFLKQAATIVEKEKQPFYSFVVTLTSHSPFDLPSKYRTLNLDYNFNSNILGDYFQSLHYTDEALGTFLKELDDKGILKDTVVAIYGDHTGVHKYYSDKVYAINPAQDWWSGNDLKIPLIIYNSSLAGKTMDVQSGQIDLMPTLSYLMGVDKSKYEKSALGKVLVNTKKNYIMLNDYSMRGQFTSKEESQAKEGIMLADKMVQSNYFKGK